MSLFLESSFIQLVLHPENSTWDFHASREEDISLDGVGIQAVYHGDSTGRRSVMHWPEWTLQGPDRAESVHGPLNQLCLHFGPDPQGLQYELTFALPDQQPMLLWKLSLSNLGVQPIYVDRLTLLQVGSNQKSKISNPQSTISHLKSPPAFFSNGWQSWSYTGVYGSGDRFRHTRLSFLHEPEDVNAGTPQPGRPGHFSSDMFGVLGSRSSRRATLAGFLSQRQHFGSIEARLDPRQPSLRLWANGDGARLDPGRQVSTDWACLLPLDVDVPDPLGPYLDAVAREHGLLPPLASDTGFGGDSRNTDHASLILSEGIPTGWCSWYQYSSDQYVGALGEPEVRLNLQAMAGLRPKLPLQLFQIDDGFESQVGDWFSFTPGFPNGVAPLAADIQAAGFTPGLWLAPFIIHPRSRLSAEHPDWLLRGRFNRPANAGYLWGSFAQALDLTHPAALEYVASVVHTAVHDWGYPYLKLDFLYAAALPGRRRDPTLTRAQTLRASLEALRSAAGEQAYLLGCGCPLGQAIGLVDAMRIGSDSAVRWYPSYHGIEFFFKSEPNFPAACNAIHNTLTRAPLHRRWWVNDPDCLLVRPASAKSGSALTLAEVQSQATAIALTGGSFLLSDDLSALPPERLRIAEALLPPIGLTPRLLDWFDAGPPQRLRLDLENRAGPWHLLAIYNWQDTAQDLILRLKDFGLDPQAEYWAREFWSSRVYYISNGALAFKDVQPHGVILLAVRPALPGLPQYVGSDLHISQGLEVHDWQADGQELRLVLERPGPAQGILDLSLPCPPQRAWLGSQSLSWQMIDVNCYRFAIDFEKIASLNLSF